MSLLPRYRHIVNPKLKHTYLSFDDEGNLIIKTPKVSQYYIEQLLLKKSAWINNAREKLLQKKGKTLDFSKSPELYWQGKTYPLILEKHTKKRVKFTFAVDTFILQYHYYDETLFQKYIDRFYKEESKNIISPLIEEWSKKMKLSPNKITFRKTKRQWGSCSGKNDLSFNTMMMKLPQDVIQYIIVHELAHIKHKHHKKAFWEEVQNYLPEYKTQVKELKKYTT